MFVGIYHVWYDMLLLAFSWLYVCLRVLYVVTFSLLHFPSYCRTSAKCRLYCHGFGILSEFSKINVQQYCSICVKTSRSECKTFHKFSMPPMRLSSSQEKKIQFVFIVKVCYCKFFTKFRLCIDNKCFSSNYHL